MNKLCLTAGLWFILHAFTSAQVLNYKNSVRVGVDYMSLDAPDDLGFRYGIRYARHFANDRIVLEGSLGYLSVENRRLITNYVYFTGRPRQRVTGDITVSFDFLRSSRHALRVGVGPSIWYRRDDDWREVRSITDQNGQVTNIILRSEQAKETNIGYHGMAEYEYAIAPRITLAGRFGVANLNVAGISSFAGINVGYRF